VFIVQAHSFKQQARLAITLAWIAGYTNVMTILACGHVTSHVSGTTSDLGRAVAERNWATTGFLLFLLLTFAAGAAASGFVCELGRRRGWESIYVVPMALEASLLTGFALVWEFGSVTSSDRGGAGASPTVGALFLLTGIASIAMGLQNATITRISSGVVRTTHVTGVLTDLGLEFAQFLYMLRDHARQIRASGAGSRAEFSRAVRAVPAHITSKRLLLLASILGSFALGAGLGTVAFEEARRWAMFPPVLFLLWIVYQDITRPIAEIEPSDLVGGENGIDLDDRLVVYHLRRDSGRTRKALRAKVHRMPNLSAWVDRVPAHVRVLILDLGDAAAIDHNSALELRNVLARLKSEGRALVLAGLSPEQYQQLRKAATGDLLSPLNACSDLELAIARGLNLLEGAPK
jgi:uncharacterized membrane protein YoaK (UPF0700 family)